MLDKRKGPCWWNRGGKDFGTRPFLPDRRDGRSVRPFCQNLVALVDVIVPYFGTYYNLGEIYRWKKEVVWGRK
jgi:hypothetical protein